MRCKYSKRENITLMIELIQNRLVFFYFYTHSLFVVVAVFYFVLFLFLYNAFNE